MSLSRSHATAFAKNGIICNTRLGAILGDTSWTEVGVTAKGEVLYFSPRGKITRRVKCKSLDEAMGKFADICCRSLEGDDNDTESGT